MGFHRGRAGALRWPRSPVSGGRRGRTSTCAPMPGPGRTARAPSPVGNIDRRPARRRVVGAALRQQRRSAEHGCTGRNPRRLMVSLSFPPCYARPSKAAIAGIELTPSWSSRRRPGRDERLLGHLRSSAAFAARRRSAEVHRVPRCADRRHRRRRGRADARHDRGGEPLNPGSGISFDLTGPSERGIQTRREPLPR